VTDPSPRPTARRFAESELPTPWGRFRVTVYRTGAEETVVLSREPYAVPVLARIHSECLTGEVFGSQRCDCRSQLDEAMARIAEEGGVLIYMRQEGRGIGLGNKIRAYALQDQGHDTVEANLALGLPADGRDYDIAVDIFRDLGIDAVRLMTNNPAKVAGLIAGGLAVTQEPHWVEAHAASQHYVRTKQAKMGHTPDLRPANVGRRVKKV
jgi:GTP cyclohydrolase II